MRVAVTGCCHGELDKIYETLALAERRGGGPADLLLCCGDFQAVRNEADLRCMAVPPKYRHMQTFYRYYSGEKKAPVLTIFIGGNHEASNHLQELPYGGWVAPNIYYLGHYECPPYDQNSVRSVYHVRNIEVFKLKQLKQPIDIFLSHDWPRSIYHYGNKKQLLQTKSFFRQEVENNTLGSPAASELLHHLKPTYWFSAHLHVKFAAFMKHQANDGQLPKVTKFLALDKCLPHRDFLQIIEVEHDSNAPDCLEYDLEWLSVLKATNSLVNVSRGLWNMPENNGLHAKWDYSATEEAMKEILEEMNHDLKVPCNFSVTAICYDPNKPQKHMELVHRISPQTTEFCAQLGLTDINNRIQQVIEESSLRGDYDDEVDSNGSGEEPSEYNTDNSVLSSSINPEEIMLDDDDEGEDSITGLPGDVSTPSVEPSLDHHPSDFSTSFSDIRILPDSMVVSSDDTMNSTNELEKSSENQESEEGKNVNERSIKRLSDETGNGNHLQKKIKRRNQAIYSAEDDSNVE
uniref:Debranching RNA lariats 1 n=1 Tax=Sarcophilus harrisii TaxID=9305 RepID=G3VX74_SARHA